MRDRAPAQSGFLIGDPRGRRREWNLLIARCGAVSLLRALVLIALCLAGEGADERRPLAEVLDSLRADGLDIVSSDALVRPDVTVAAPAVGTALERLHAALVGAGLRAVAGPHGSWLVIAAAPWRARPPVVVSDVLVTNGNAPDVSSIEAWKRSVITPGMSDRDKALAVWRTAVAFEHQDHAPDERLESGGVHDPITCINVYGYGADCCSCAIVEALARAAGLEARGWQLKAHSVAEVRYDGAWHMLDASMICYFPKEDGALADVAEITDSVSGWIARRDRPMDDAGLLAFMRSGGWRTGPDALARSPFFDDNGWLPAATHGWYSMIRAYADRSANYLNEFGCAQGYRVNVQLRPGERLTRRWGNSGLHIDQRSGAAPEALGLTGGQGSLRYSPAYGDLAPGRIGNGTLAWDVPLATATLARVALACENLSDSVEGIVVADATKPAVLTLRERSSYVFLSGAATLDAVIGAGGSLTVELSRNNGLDWAPVATLVASGARVVPLDDLVFRLYDYRLRLTLSGMGIGLRSLTLSHDVQHSQRALPALAQGDNRISFSSGDEGTVTVFGSTNPDTTGNLRFADFHPTLEGIDPSLLRANGPTGSIVVPVATPGAMTRLRLGIFYRARDANDGWEALASFDGGKTWTMIGRCPGPVVGDSRTFALAAPVGARQALVRLDARQRNTSCIFDLRIDADYLEPAAGSAPVQVTYVWDEDGRERRDVHVAATPRDAWSIACAKTPLMKELVVEFAP